MIKSKKNFFLGVFIFLIPFMGLPTSWKMNLIIISGILLILFSVKFSIPKKLPKRPLRRKTTDVFAESIPPQTQTQNFMQPTIESVGTNDVKEA